MYTVGDGGARPSRVGIVGAFLIAVLGCVFVASGLYVRHQGEPYPGGKTVTGTVTDIATSHDTNGRRTYSRIYTFKTEDGRSITTTEQGSSSKVPTRGSEVKVSYLPSQPESSRVVSGSAWWAYAIIGAGVLVALFGLGTFLLRLLTLIAGISLFSSMRR